MKLEAFLPTRNRIHLPSPIPHSAEGDRIVEIAPGLTRPELERETGGLVPIRLQGKDGVFCMSSLLIFPFSLWIISSRWMEGMTTITT